MRGQNSVAHSLGTVTGPRRRNRLPSSTAETPGHAAALVAKSSARLRLFVSGFQLRLPASPHRLTVLHLLPSIHGCGSPLLLRTGRLSRREPPPRSYPWPSRPPGHTIERLLPLPRVAQPRRRAGHARAPQSQDGATDEKAVPAGALLPHLPAPARPTPAGGHQVPRRRLHRRRPRGHLRVSSSARGFHSIP